MLTYAITIDAVTRYFRGESMWFAATANGVDTLGAEVVSLDGSYTPGRGDEIVVTEDGDPIFGGFVTSVTVVGLGGKGVQPIVNRISASDYNVLATRRYVTDTVPAGSLESQLQWVIDNYLTDYSVTLDAGQVTGPTLAAIDGAFRRVDVVLTDIVTAAKASTSTSTGVLPAWLMTET